MFLPEAGTGIRIDLGASLGHGTNNLGEVFAIGLCLQVLFKIFPVHPFPSAVLFTDSKYALQVLSSRTSPSSNAHAVSAVRLLIQRCSQIFKVSLHWVKGHAGVPGNSIADQIAGHFAPVHPNVSPPSPVTQCGVTFDLVSFMLTPIAAFGAFSPFIGALTSIVPVVDFSGFSPLPFNAVPSQLSDDPPGSAPGITRASHVRQRKRPVSARTVSPPRRLTTRPAQ